MSTEQRPRSLPGSGRIATLRAQKVLEGDYERLHQTTLSALSNKLRGQGVHFDRADLDGFYNQAWHALYAKLADGDTIDNTGAFLTQVAYFRAIDEYRKLHPDRRAEIEDAGDLAGVEVDVDAQLDDAHQLREFLAGLKSRLDEREARAAALCYVHGYSRPEAAKIIGVSASRMEKLMDRVSKVVRSLTAEIDSGQWCESQRSLMTAYAVNVLDTEGERYKLAVVHLQDCPGCRAYVRRLRGISGVVPPILLPWGILGIPAAHVVGQAAHGGAGSLAASPGGASSGSSAAAGSGSGGGGAGGVPKPGPSKMAIGAATAATVAVAAAAAFGVAAVVRDGDDGNRPATAGGTAGSAAAPSSGGTGGAGGGGGTSAAKARAAAKASKAAKAKAARARARRARAAQRAEAARVAAQAAQDAQAAAAAAAAAQPPPPAAQTPAETSPPPATSGADSSPAARTPTVTSTTPQTSTQAEPDTVETDAEQEFGIEP